MSEGDFLSVREVAERTGLSAATVARMCRNGEIPAVQSGIRTGTGSAWMIRVEDVPSIPRRKRGRPFAAGKGA